MKENPRATPKNDETLPTLKETTTTKTNQQQIINNKTKSK